MADWHDYERWAGGGKHSVTGNIKVLPDLWSPELENRRPVFVYLPPSYAAGDRRYPVLYMQDGQNLFDWASSYAGEWEMDETMEKLAQEGLEAIVVGLANMGELRVDEYTPFPDSIGGGGQGDTYMSFIVSTVKPLIDADFRTLPGQRYTGLGGSSLGGLISLYGLFRHGDVFGLCAAFSPALGGADGEMFEYVEHAGQVEAKIYMDCGTREAVGILEDPAGTEDFSLAYLEDVRQMYRFLIEKGYRTGADLLYVEDEGAVHHETSWARRAPHALRFLLRD